MQQGNNKKKKLKTKVTQETIDKIIYNYNSGMGLKASGEEFYIGPYAVRNILTNNNITIRTQSDSAILSNINRKNFFCNLDYFKSQSSNMAYILGFLVTDGYIPLDKNEVKITSAQKEAELLEKIKKELEYTGN